MFRALLRIAKVRQSFVFCFPSLMVMLISVFKIVIDCDIITCIFYASDSGYHISQYKTIHTNIFFENFDADIKYRIFVKTQICF